MVEAERPYFHSVGDVVAAAVALVHHVRELRPETLAIPGTFYVGLDMEAGVVLVALAQADARMVLIERILVDPAHPETFGASTLPVVMPTGGEPVH